jgi:carotenoid cleavage oxygenase
MSRRRKEWAVMTNRYLQDNFAPVREEQTVTDLPVTGKLPRHLDGRYLRIGPNPLGDPGERHHWFLGDGMVHGVRIVDGQAKWYRNRYVRSNDVSRRLGEPVSRPDWPVTDFAANTHVLSHAGKTLALVEAGSPPYELTEELDTVGPTDFDGTLRMGHLPAGYSAHPHEDPETGELHAVSYNWLRGNRVDYTVRGTDGHIRRTVPVQVGGSPMMHDFALTENYVVLYDLPVVFDKAQAIASMPRAMRIPARLMLGAIIGRNPLPDPVINRIARGGAEGRIDTLPYSWDPDYPARLGLLPREGGPDDVRWFEIDPCFVFHTVNAYEDGDTVVVDVVRHPRMFATVLNGPDEGPATMARFTIDLVADKVREDRFDDHSQEFPRIDERFTGRRHRFGYSVGLQDRNTPGDAVLRHDLAAGSTTVRNLGSGRDASEFCFVEHENPKGEADGVLMGYVYDRAGGTSDLVILDAETLEDVAAVHLPARVPAGFHGSWSPTPR